MASISGAQSIRRVPWTCRWGRFGGPIPEGSRPVPGFQFWVCSHPVIGAPTPLGRDSCAQCAFWEGAPDPPDCR